MENNIVSGAIGATIMSSFYIAYRIIQYINHTRIRSSCCGKKMEASIDIEATSPQEKKSENVQIQIKPPSIGTLDP
jgi:hypothetical protein